jgi:hypothetical protein
MIYRIVSCDRTTERMKGSMIVPPTVLGQVKTIAGFQPQDDGLGEYPLNDEQTRQVANILGFRLEPDRFYYSVEPYDPPEDSGFQEQSSGASAGEL